MYINELIAESEPDRLVLCPESIGVPGVRLLGRLTYTRAHPPLPPHAHEYSTEICLLARGRQTFTAEGKDFPIRGGDVFVTAPDTWHGTGGTPVEPCVLYWIQLDTRPGSDLLGLPVEDARRLAGHFGEPRTRSFRIPRKTFELCEESMQAALEAAPAFGFGERMPGKSGSAEFAVLRCRILLAQVLLLVADAEFRRIEGSGMSKRMADAVRYMEEHLCDAIPLSELAAVTGLSLPRFKAVFKNTTGSPPGEYLSRLRIERAEELLRGGDRTVTDVAFLFGFSSSQYFSQVYRKFKGHPPGDLIDPKKHPQRRSP